MPVIGTCSVCKREDLNVWKNRFSGLPWCDLCRKRSRKKEKCVHCGEVKPVEARTGKGEPRCKRCYQQMQPMAPCFQCADNIPKRVASRRDGRPLCWSCAHVLKTREPCSECGKQAIAARRNSGKPLCRACVEAKVSFRCGVCAREKRGYAMTRGRDGKPICRACTEAKLSFQCGLCEQEKRGYPATTEDGPVCHNCHLRHRRARCDFCAEIRPIKSMTGGKNKCQTCYAKSKPKVDCSICGGKSLWVSARFEGKPVCHWCYRKHLAPRESCSACGERRPVAKRLGNTGLPLCKNCLSKQGLKLYGRCDCCDNYRSIELLSGGDEALCASCSGEMPNEYEPCRECGLKRRVRVRDEHKRPICLACYRAFGQ